MREGYRWRLFFFLALCMALSMPATLLSAEFFLDSETRVRVFERDTSEEDDALIVPAYEYLRLDAGNLKSRGLSFHLYGWGRVDFGEDGFFEEDSAGELLYGYLQYAHPETTFTAQLGRFYVFEGVTANESIEGLRASVGVTEHFSVSAYAGYPVALDDTDGFEGDFTTGGRIAHHLNTLYEIGASYNIIYNDADQEEQRIGLDLALNFPFGASIFGFSSYNLESEGWAEHSWELQFAFADLQIRPYFQRYRFEDYFDDGVKTPDPFDFIRDTGEDLTVYGADVTRLIAENWEAGVKGKALEYDDSDDAQYFAGLINWFGEDLTSAGAELGFMNSDTADNDYILSRIWAYLDQLPPLNKGFVTGDIVYVYYDEDIFNEDASFFLSLGAGRRFLNDSLEVEVSGDYSSDPFFDDDLRGMVVARYLYSRDLPGF